MSAAASARDPRVRRALALLRAPGDGGEVLLDDPALVAGALAEGARLRWALAREPGAWAHLGCPVIAAAPDALRALGALGQPAEVAAVAALPPAPRDVPAGSVVLAGLRDAGNVGSIVRTAAALGVPRVVLCGAGADPFARRALRASRGAALRAGLVARGRSLEDVPAPRAAAVARGGVEPAALPAGASLVLGSERDGLGAAERARCELAVSVPAPGFESLNVAAAAAILLWELRSAR